MTNGTATVTFNYTAPVNAGTDTVWAVGIATNKGSNSSGDSWNHAVSKKIVVSNLTGIDPVISPAEFNIGKCYPNPFNPSTNIDISLIKQSNVNIKIFDVNGSEVYTVINKLLNAGDHTFTWNAVNNAGSLVNTGVYFMRISVGSNTVTRKLILIK
jgi:hypothetical protein